MYIVRWLTGHPMIAVWFLGAIAILLSYGSFNKKEGYAKEEQIVKTAEVSSSVTTTEILSSESNKQEMKLREINNAKESLSSKNDSTEVVHNKNAQPADASNSQKEVIDTNKKEKADAQETTESRDSSVLNKTLTLEENVSEVDSTNTGSISGKKEEPKEHKAGDVVKLSDKNSAAEDTVQIENRSKEKIEGHAVSLDLSAQSDKKHSYNLNNDDSEVADLGQLSSEEMLKMAREAYWNNGLDEAAQIYKQLIKIEPKVVEHRGELGNVYWRQGYPKEAAEIYSEIAIPMIENGNSNRVANMVGFIGLFYPDRASVIHDRLQRAQEKK